MAEPARLRFEREELAATGLASPRVIAAASSGPPNAPLHLDLAAALVPPR